MTARKVKTRAKEHRTFSTAKNVYYHINSCPNYLSRLLKFENENFKPEDKINVKKKLRDVFFIEHFTILQKSFRSYSERRKTEAFFIRILRPDLNEQTKHRFFTLFWCGHFLKNQQAHIIFAPSRTLFKEVIFSVSRHITD